VEKKIERLDAGPIPNQQKALLNPIPDRESKHSDEAFDRCDSPQRIRFQHDLRIARALELNAVRSELGPNLPEIIDFAIEYGRVATVAETIGWCPEDQIQDRKSTMAKPQCVSVANVFPCRGIRPAMGQALQSDPALRQFPHREVTVVAMIPHTLCCSSSYCPRFG
jgi:hypothetical protein